MLDRLPNEVLHLVLKNLATKPDLIHGEKVADSAYHLDQWKTLAHLCKVSRQMRHVAEPLLYQNYAKPDSASNPVAHYSFRKYLTTVLRRPELLQHVRSLYIGSWKHFADRDLQYAAKSRFAACTARICDIHFPPELHTLYNKHANTAVLGGTWKEALNAGEEIAEIALLMSLTPNLERIEFSMPHLNLENDTAPLYFWPNLLVASAEWDPSSHFHRLEAVTAHKRNLKPAMRESPHYGFEIDPFLPFIGLPKLAIFWAEDDTAGFYQTRLEEYPLSNGKSLLTDLTLYPSNIHPSKLLHILNCCIRLEAFHMDFQKEVAFVPGFSWDTIGQALRRSQHSLKEIDMSADMRSQLATEMAPNSEGTCVAIGSLRNFTSLETLDVLQTTLLGFENMADELELVVPALSFEEMLPSSLRSLTIDVCTMTVVPYLEGLASKLEENFPNLEEARLSQIDLKEFDMDNYEYPEDQHEALMKGREDRVERIKEAFEQAGVKWI